MASRIYSLLILVGQAMPAKRPNINRLQYVQITGPANLRLVTDQLPLNWLFCIQLNLCFSRESVYCELSSLGGNAHSSEQSSEQEKLSSPKCEKKQVNVFWGGWGNGRVISGSAGRSWEQLGLSSVCSCSCRQLQQGCVQRAG